MGKLTDSIAAFSGRLMAAFARHSPQTATAAPPQIQSVDQLSTLLQNLNPDASQVNRPLSTSDARHMWWRWQYAAVTALAEAVMMNPWHIEVRKSDTWEEAPDHPLVTLLDYVNPFMTGPELKYWTVVEGQLIGQSFLRIVRRGDEPVELWPLMGRVEPVPDPKTVVSGWKEIIQKKNGGERTVEHALEDIVYIRLPKPGDLMGGYGPVQAAGASIRLDQQIIESNWAAIKNGVIPFAVATIKPEAGNVDADKREQLRNEINERYAGAKKTGGTMMQGDLLDIKWPPHKPREMGYPEAANMARDDILGALRVPAAILGLSKDVNRSSAEGMEYVFAKWRVTPLLHLYYSRLQQDLVRPNYGDDVRIVYDSPVPADRAQETNERDMRLRQGAITINEDREQEGREPVEWGEEPWMSVALVQPSMGRDEPKDEQAQQFVEQAKGPRGFSREQRAKLARAAARGQTRLREKLTRVYRGIFKKVKADVLAAWDESSEAELRAVDWITQDLPPKVDSVLDLDKLRELIESRTNTTTKWGVMLGGEFESAINGGDDRPWNEGLDAIDRYAAQYGHTHDLDIAATTRQEMMDAVAAGIKENESWDELRLRVGTLFDGMMESRAANIATTETTKLYGAGGHAFRDEYGITHKQWVASHVNTRATHAAADAAPPIKNGDMFAVGSDHMMFPGDGAQAGENCNCNCCAVGVVK